MGRQAPGADQTFTHSDTLISVSFSPDGRRLVTGAAENTVGLWDRATGARLATLTGHTGPVATVAFAPAGRGSTGGVSSGISSADTRTITWTTDEDDAIHAICGTIRRGLTREEQNQFFPEAEHPDTCP